MNDKEGTTHLSCGRILHPQPLTDSENKGSPNLSPMQPINTIQTALLSELLKQSEQGLAPVNAKRFRANHFENVAEIEDLVRRHLIHMEGENLRLSITALPILHSELATALLASAEVLWQVFREHYKLHLEQPIYLSDLAKRSGADFHATRRVLTYMLEYPWWSGRSNPADKIYETVCASEKVLKFETFRACIEDMATWHRFEMTAANTPNLLRPEPISSFDPGGSSIPHWTHQLPTEIANLVREVYAAKASNLPTLCAMGIRAVIDLTSVSALGYDAGHFEKKLNELREQGHITEVQRAHLSAVVDAASAAAHRGFVPEAAALSTMMDAMQHLLHTHYLYPKSTQSLESTTPPRKPLKRSNLNK